MYRHFGAKSGQRGKKMKSLSGLWLFCLCAAFAAPVDDTLPFAPDIAVRSWKEIRDWGIVKQDLDYSCGAASLATLLNQQYGMQVTEEAVLDLLAAVGRKEGMASFADMQAVLPALGFRGEGFALSFAQLSTLRAPVIVYLRYRSNDHFSVLRGIDGETVLLADPSLGHISLQRDAFLRAWQTRGGALAGKVLAVVPDDAQISVSPVFFTRTPIRQTAAAMRLLQMPARY